MYEFYGFSVFLEALKYILKCKHWIFKCNTKIYKKVKYSFINFLLQPMATDLKCFALPRGCSSLSCDIKPKRRTKDSVVSAKH